ncbi:hypothetical protein EJB05_12645, partial [Eragrostis curvula]
MNTVLRITSVKGAVLETPLLKLPLITQYNKNLYGPFYPCMLQETHRFYGRIQLSAAAELKAARRGAVRRQNARCSATLACGAAARLKEACKVRRPAGRGGGARGSPRLEARNASGGRGARAGTSGGRGARGRAAFDGGGTCRAAFDGGGARGAGQRSTEVGRKEAGRRKKEERRKNRDSTGMEEATPTRQRPSSWSDLQWDLSGKVLRLLPALADRACFAAVCLQWRAAARQLPLPPALPLLALRNGTFYSLPYGKPFHFPGFGGVGYQNAACGSWLVIIRDDGCFLFDPFAGATVTLPTYVKCAECTPIVPGGSYNRIWMDIKDPDLTLKKLILCSPSLVAAFVVTGTTSKILMCRPGASLWSLSVYYNPREVFQDMAFYQGKLYALTDHENLLVINISQEHGDPQVSRIGQVIKGDPDRLFEAWAPYANTVCCRVVGDNIVADQQSSVFEVMKADFESSKWVNVSTLGDDQVLFLGRPCSRAVPASHYKMSGDQIFFLDDVPDIGAMEYIYDEDNTSVSVYNMKTGEVSSHLPKVRKHDMIFATWLFP